MRSSRDAFALSRRVLSGLITINQFYGILILMLFVASLLDAELIFGTLGVRFDVDNTQLIRGMRAVMVLGLLAVPLAHIVLERLLAIVDTVGEGSPFVAANATRLRSIAWAVLGLELCQFAIGITTVWASSGPQPLDIDWGFSATRWIAVLLLFVLARVFEQGTRMREELEGTV